MDGRGSVLLWLRCDMSCTSGFMDDVVFTHNDPLASPAMGQWGMCPTRLPTIYLVLLHCWLGGRKGIRPIKTEWWGAGVVICLERGADLHMAQLMPLPLTVSRFSKIQIGFTFLEPAHPSSPGQRAVKRVCTCVSVCVLHVRCAYGLRGYGRGYGQTSGFLCFERR